jgi:hypothetical protein
MSMLRTGLKFVSCEELRPCMIREHLRLAQLLEIPLRNKSFNISLPDIELAVLRQSDGPIIPELAIHCSKSESEEINIPILRLNLPGILQNSNINEQISRRLQTPRQINISPLALICSKQIIIESRIFLLLGT